MVSHKIRIVFLALVFALASRSAAGAPPRITPPKPIDKTEAPYPPDGKGDASVTVVLFIDRAGTVTDVTLREGASPFAEAAMAAVKTWTFTPATRDDVPIASRISAVVTFHAPSQAPQAIEPDASQAQPQPTGHLGKPSPQAHVGTPQQHDDVIEVAVKGEHEELGTIHIPRSQTRLIPGAFGDPFRVVEALPGMSPWLSGLPYFYVRGMSPENVGYFIDGIKIPLLFHVGSGPSTIAASLVDTVDLFPAAYPARYGRFAGAVIAGETVPPASQAHGELQVRVFDAAAAVEVPFRDGRESALAAVRYGYTGLILSIIDPHYTLSYWDYQTRVSHRLPNGDQLSLFVFGSYDELDNYGSPTFHVQYHRADLRFDHPLHDGNVRVAATFNYDDTMTALLTPTGAGTSASLKGPGGRLRAELDTHVSKGAWVRAGADVNITRFDVDQSRARSTRRTPTSSAGLMPTSCGARRARSSSFRGFASTRIGRATKRRSRRSRGCRRS